MQRSRDASMDWTLTAMPGWSLRHVGKCLFCSHHSVDSCDPDEAQLWCLKHARTTRHTGYELSSFQFYSATITDPAVGEAGSLT